MKRHLLFLVLILAGPRCLAQETPEGVSPFWPRMRVAIQKHLGRPYVWGASGLKSFDCSGFVWRSLADSGYLLKRTSARKMFFSLQEADPEHPRSPGNLVFFDDLGHVGIVQDETSFFHSATSKGTSQGTFHGHWEGLVTGYRSLQGVAWVKPKTSRKSKSKS